MVSFAEPTEPQGTRQDINYLGEKSHFIQPGNVMGVAVRGMNVDVSFSWSLLG